MNARRPASLPRRARSMLAQYREAEDIPSDVEDRIWAVVGAEDAPAPTLEPSLDEDVPEDSGRTRTLGWIGLGLAAAAVLAVAWSVGGTIAERRHASTSHEAPMQADVEAPQGHAAKARGAGVAEVRTTAPPSSETAERVDDASPQGDAVEPEPAQPRVAPRPERAVEVLPTEIEIETKGAEVEPVPTSSTGTLAAERELIARAWRALAHGDTAAALAAVGEHARRFDAGLLAPEREAVEAIARCRNEEAGAPGRAQAFHRAHPRSPLADRVDEACGTTGEEK